MTAPTQEGGGWSQGNPGDYDRAYAVDLAQLTAFVHATQPHLVEPLGLDDDSVVRRKFLARLQGEVSKRGVVAVLRNGLQHGAHSVDLYYPTPSPGNVRAAEQFSQNRFTLTRQLHYSPAATALSLDLAAFVALRSQAW